MSISIGVLADLESNESLKLGVLIFIVLIFLFAFMFAFVRVYIEEKNKKDL